MRIQNCFRFLLALTLFSVCTAGLAQVDETPTTQDTLFIYEEEVVYDTLYLYDSIPQLELMSKEELLEAFQRDRGVGSLYYQRGHMYITSSDGELYRLNDPDLKYLLSASDYADYHKAKRNIYGSIPLYVATGAGAALAGTGLYQFCAGFVSTAKYGDLILDDEQLGRNIWRSSMAGLFFFAGGALATTAFILPAIILTAKGKVGINRITNNFNAPSTSLRLSFGPAPGGAGVTLSF